MSEPSTNPTRRALRALTHGAYVLSVAHGQQDDCLIVSLVMQCSVEPPRIAMALTHRARILPALVAAKGGVLAVLDASQLAAVRRYGAPGGVRNPPRDAQRTSEQHVIPPEAAFWMEFSLMSTTNVGDHTLVVATVTGAGAAAMPPAPQAAGDAQGSVPLCVPADAAPPTPGDAPTFAPMTLAASGFPYGG